ncbi:unnamed protein product [Urochloa humidicola]
MRTATSTKRTVATTTNTPIRDGCPNVAITMMTTMATRVVVTATFLACITPRGWRTSQSTGSESAPAPETATPMECDPPVPLHDSIDGPLEGLLKNGMAQAEDSAYPRSDDLLSVTADDTTPLVPQAPAVDDLFTTPVPSVLPTKPVRAQRQRRTFDMSAVRRSTRLANQSPMSSLQRAQKNLLRKLGLQVAELTPIEEVLKEYVKSITGPLPDYIIAAFATMLDLDDDDKDKMTEALLQHAGEGVADLQEEQDALLRGNV